jgi:hypothetical protein
MKPLFATIAISLMLSGVAHCETLMFPSEAPIARITIPDSWSPAETETGVEATSDDSAIYLSVDVADEKTSDKVIDDAIAFLQQNGVKIDGTTQKRSDEKINGMDMANFGWTGTDSDGPVDVSLSLLSPTPGKLLVITYWGSKATQEKHARELLDIAHSIQPAGK